MINLIKISFLRNFNLINIYQDIFNKNNFFISLDQLCVSLFNLYIIYFIGKNFGLEDLGQYSLLFGFYLFLNIIIQSSIYEPMMMYENMNLDNIFFVILLIILSILLIFLLSFKFVFENLFNIKISIFFFLFFVFEGFKNFLKKTLAIKKKSKISLIMTLISIIIVTICLNLYSLYIEYISDIFKFFALGQSIFFVSCIYFYFTRLVKINLKEIIDLVQKLKYRFLNIFSYMGIMEFNGFVFIYLLSNLINYEIVGIHRIIISILGAMHIFFRIFENIYPSMLSEKYQNSSKKFKNIFFSHLILWCSFFLIISFILFINIENLVFYLFAIDFNEFKLLYLACNLVLFADLINVFVINLLRIINKISILKYLSLAVIFLTICFGTVLLFVFQFKGLVIFYVLLFIIKTIFSITIIKVYFLNL